MPHAAVPPFRLRLLLILVLVLFVAVAYGPGFSLPFIGDDYVFLDETRAQTFAQLWSPANTTFGWYRPMSRELHFWLLQRTVGLHEVAFRGVGALLWVATLTLYAAVVRRVASSTAAVVATLGVASLALWGTPLLWISGSQDLWMVLFAMATLLLFIVGRGGWAALPFALALLSKETAAVLPALLVAYSVIVVRRPLKQAWQQTAHLWALLLVWLTLHPTLHRRFVDSTWRQTPEGEHRPSQLGILLQSALATVNLNGWPKPIEVGALEIAALVATVAILAGGLAWLMRLSARENAAPSAATPRRLVGFALAWVALGWLPLFLPSIGWHAYYGCLGALGAWLILAMWLEKRPRIAAVAMCGLAILQWTHAHTASWDWGNEWYQRRAGRMVEGFRRELMREHPTFPAHTRVYFGNVPNNIGLVAGRSPAVRVWYRDPTLQAGFYSYYRKRAPSEAAGQDYFFHFDSLAGLVEVKAGAEDVGRAQAANPNWAANHEALAMRFLEARDPERAAQEFEKIAQLPNRADAAGLSGVCWAASGDTARADSLFRSAQQRLRLPDAQMREWIAELEAGFPHGDAPVGEDPTATGR